MYHMNHGHGAFIAASIVAFILLALISWWKNR